MEIHCCLCGKEFKQYRGRKRCGSCTTKIRRFRAKQAAIKYLGGKCQRCGFDKHSAALEFHHTDPKEKDFTLGNVGNKTWALLKKELDKCILLCSNCHKIEHHGGFSEEFLAAAYDYKGKELIF